MKLIYEIGENIIGWDFQSVLILYYSLWIVLQEI